MRVELLAVFAVAVAGCYRPCSDVAMQEEQHTLAIEQCQQTPGCVVTLHDLKLRQDLRERAMECRITTN